MKEIKEQFKSGKLDVVTAARKLNRHNGNGLTSNLMIVKNW